MTTSISKLFAASAAVASTIAIVHVLKVRNVTCLVPTNQIISSPSVPESLRQSKATLITNPKGHVTVDDTRCITLNLPAHLSDEEILASFVKGFFGGHVFAPERSVLKAVGRELTVFESLKKTPVSLHIWKLAQLKKDTAPPLDAVLFGVFRVVDRCIQETPSAQQEPSYIDFAFGFENGNLAGVHRFSVKRSGDAEAAGASSVTIEFAHTGCNPQINEPLKPEVLQTLHLAYAMLLFREGVAEVLKM